MKIQIKCSEVSVPSDESGSIFLKLQYGCVLDVFETTTYYVYKDGDYTYSILKMYADIVEEKLINNFNKMNIKEKFVLALTKEPQKSFRKVGITNGDDILTDDGEKVFISWLLHSKFAEEFKKDVVVDMLKELRKEEEK